MSINVVKDPVMYKNTWRIDNFSELDAESYDSKEDTALSQVKKAMELVGMAFVLKDTCFVEAEVTVHGITSAL
ncbi:hypothetical protein ACFX15_011666 [Malus domestica]